MINKSKIEKKFLTDLFINTFSFAIYIILQQLIFMPSVSRTLDDNSFATFVVYISIFSIISNTLGSELGIVRQIFNDKKEYEKYNQILFYLLIFVFIISFLFILMLKYSLFSSFMLSIIVVLANLRLYVSAYFRMYKSFKSVLFQNILYLIGMVIGLLIFGQLKLVWIPLIIGELFAGLFSIMHSDVKYIFRIKFHKKIDKKIFCSLKNYSLIEFLINMMTYFDKILIYPILGVNAVNVYYATTTMSKMASLITNPLHGVLLSWLKSDDKQNRNYIVSLCLKFCLPVVIFISMLSIPLTYYAVKILYYKYLSQSLIIIIPIGIGVGFSFASNIIKVFLLKYIQSKDLLKTYIYYLIAFVFLSITLSSQFKLLGFAIANMISRIILVILFFILLVKIKNGEMVYED